MNSKAARFSFLLFQLLVFILGIGICIFGIVRTEDTESIYRYICAVARLFRVFCVSIQIVKLFLLAL